MGNTVQKGIPIDMIKHISQGRQGTRLAPKYKGKHGAPAANNIGLFHGSAISALLVIVDMGDVMRDNAALIRRSNLPTRISPDRPSQQAKQHLRGTIAAKNKNNAPLQEQQIARTIKNTQNNKGGKINSTT